MNPDLQFDFTPTRQARERIQTAYLRAERQAVTEITREAEQALEAATASAGLGRLARAWTSRIYPRGGLAKNPVGFIFPKGGTRTTGAVRSYTRGASIRGTRGQFLAIPTPAAGSRGRGRNLTPGEWEARTGQRLRFVYRPGRPSLLVAEGVANARSGRFRPITRRRTKADERLGTFRGTQTIVIFVLLPVVNVRSRVSIESVLAPFPSRLAARFLVHANQVR